MGSSHTASATWSLPSSERGSTRHRTAWWPPGVESVAAMILAKKHGVRERSDHLSGQHMQNTARLSNVHVGTSLETHRKRQPSVLPRSPFGRLFMLSAAVLDATSTTLVAKRTLSCRFIPVDALSMKTGIADLDFESPLLSQ